MNKPNKKKIQTSLFICVIILILIISYGKSFSVITIPFFYLNNTVYSSRILIMVLTSEENILTRGIAIWNTWAKHDSHSVIFACNCSKIMLAKTLLENNLTLTNEMNIYRQAASLPILNLQIKEDINQMGHKVLLVLKESYKFYKNSFNWYFMVDDDTYVFVDNLYDFVKFQNTSSALYYGFKYKHYFEPIGYIGGGSGILFTDMRGLRLKKGPGITT